MDEGASVKKQCARALRDAGYKVLAAELEFGSLASVAKDEPVFVLCARDRLAATAIQAWINAARVSNVPDHKLESAHQLIEAMNAWTGDRHYPD
jgi:hypothetical protein